MLARDDLLLKITTGQYKTVANPCAVCEEGSEPKGPIDEVVAEVDRYGIPTQTVMCKKCGMLRIDPVFRNSDYSDSINLITARYTAEPQMRLMNSSKNKPNEVGNFAN